MIYDDSGIEAVYPHDDGDRVWTIHDGLDRLRAKSENPNGEMIDGSLDR